MSLTALVRHLTPVRAPMSAEFPRQRLPLKAELLVAPVAPNQQLIGTAYDYLLRFHLMRIMPFAKCETWVAERALSLVSRYGNKSLLIMIGERDLRISGEIRA